VALALWSVFADVVLPVFAIVGLGYLLGPRLGLEARTLARTAYYVFVPAFMFDVIARADVELARAARMAAFAVATHLAFAALGWGVARALGRPREVVAGFVMLAVFGNVGNFGLALVTFRLGPEALVPASIYFIVILVVAFAVSVGAAAWARGGGALHAMGQVVKTPALVVVLPAALVSGLDLHLPLALTRAVGLLGGAMIPTMLFVLGLQLSEAKGLRLSGDVLLASALRLVAAPALAALLVPFFGLKGLERAAGLLQAAMPAAILVAIVSLEYRVAPQFVMSAVVWSTLLSLPTLTVLLALV